MHISKEIDTDEAIAWQRGYFHYTHANIRDVLRQLARWYDVEIAFTIPVPTDYTFDGEIGRDLNLSTILKHLEKNDLHFHIEGKKLIVSK
jgi:ferric-dicitrate binding protein FerR (iron transport regulator)